MPDRLEALQAKQAEFVAARDWERYHRPKNLAMALSVEAGELEELYQWREAEPSDVVRDHPDLRADTREELADVFIYALSLADQLDIDLCAAAAEKIEANAERYPADDPPDPVG